MKSGRALWQRSTILHRNLRLAALLLLVLATGAAADGGPATVVSPGEIDHAAEIATSCPTFNWSAVDGAAGYELAVFALVEPEEPKLALRHLVEGSALGWTPGRTDCLAPGPVYAWTVRALDANGQPLGGESAWAVPRRFAVPELPGDAEVADALEVLRRWQAARADGRAGPLPAEASIPTSQDLSGEAVTVSGIAAIRGEIPGVTGETYGVFGISSSLQGAGLVGLNTSFGPDLVLDGSYNGQVDTLFTQSGIDRPSASPQTFNLQNSSGGGMALQVQGTAVSLTGHAHSGAEITSGTVAEPRLDATLARDSEILPTVLAGDGPGSTLDADTLDGLQAVRGQPPRPRACRSRDHLRHRRRRPHRFDDRARQPKSCRPSSPATATARRSTPTRSTACTARATRRASPASARPA